MRVERLHIEEAPGLPDGLPELELEPGLTVIVGPNASGKSTLARVLRELLWPTSEGSGASARSRWAVSDGTHSARLSAGHVSWQPHLDSPPPRGAAGLARFSVRTLLDDDDGDDQQLGQRIARELAGGLDLPAAAGAFDRAARLAKNHKLSKARASARRELQLAKGSTGELATKDRKLALLLQEIDATRGASKRKQAAELLRELLLALDALAGLEREEFATGLDQLVGDEIDRSQELAGELERLGVSATDLESQFAALATTIDTNAFPGDPPGRQALDAWTTRLRTLALTADRLPGLSVGVASADTCLAERRAAVSAVTIDDIESTGADGASADDATDTAGRGLSASSLDELARSIGDVREAEAELKTQCAAVSTWERWAQAGGDDADSLRSAINGLRGWLRSSVGGPAGDRAPASHEAPAPKVLAWALLAAGFVCVVVAATMDVPWLAAGLALSGWGGALLRRPAAPRDDAPSDSGHARAAFEATIQSTPHAPSTWEVSAVEQHLTRLQRRLVELDLSARAHEQLETARQLRSEAEQRAEATADARREVAARVGSSQDFVELGAVSQAHALMAWRDARAEHTQLSAKLEETQRAVDKQLAACVAWLATQGCDAPTDVAAAQAELDVLGRRCTDLTDARKQAGRVRGEQRKNQKALDLADEESDALWERAKIERGKVAALAQRLREHERWVTHQGSLWEARKGVDSCRVRFAQAADLPQLDGTAPEKATLEQVDGWIAALDEEAETFGELNSSAGGIQEALRSARRGHDFANALAATVAAEQEVADERERAVVDALARSLLDEAREQHETAHAPPTLQRAQERFSQFTQGHWRLEVNDGAFCARDVSEGQTRSLAELSDGTRAQLLLAVRLAALQEMEAPGEPLPVCLDETLSIADPVRFEAIASALLKLADGGRQILYFTANPGEVAQWAQVCKQRDRPAPHVLDLAVLGGAPVDWGGELPAVPPEPERVPDPDGMTNEQYAQLLSVRAPDGFREVGSWHLYIGAHDDLEALAICMRFGIKTLGHWQEASRRGAAAPEIPADVAGRFSARAALAQAVVDGWRTGRGRPVTWDDVQSSGAVSENFAQQVRDLLKQHARDPAAFVEAVRRLDRFRAAKADQLSEKLDQLGCLPQGAVLLIEDLVRRSLQAAPDAVQLLGPEQAAVFVTWLNELLCRPAPSRLSPDELS
ncbi:MAG: hypothetical protein DRQ55_14710 [Planctomycetota bacterium]|nr:MAG: hypothetical protein DRQ55_14710 [Planctomycetota bacterium]